MKHNNIVVCTDTNSILHKLIKHELCFLCSRLRTTQQAPPITGSIVKTHILAWAQRILEHKFWYFSTHVYGPRATKKNFFLAVHLPFNITPALSQPLLWFFCECYTGKTRFQTTSCRLLRWRENIFSEPQYLTTVCSLLARLCTSSSQWFFSVQTHKKNV